MIKKNKLGLLAGMSAMFEFISPELRKNSVDELIQRSRREIEEERNFKNSKHDAEIAIAIRAKNKKRFLNRINKKGEQSIINNMTTEPILTETIGNTNVTLRPLQNGGYLISASGECVACVLKMLLEDAINEFGYMFFKLSEFTEGRENNE